MTVELKPKRVAVLGAGKMGATLIRALVASEVVMAENIVATARHQERLDRVASDLGVQTTLDNREAVRNADLILLCVKPQTAAEVLEQIGVLLGAEQVLVSILAGVTTAFIEQRIAEGVPVVRAMPNTPCQVSAGMTAICGGRWATGDHLVGLERIFEHVGRALILDEKYFDAVTGLSASGPAFLYVIIESLAEGGVKVGLPREVATELAAQTCLGAARMVLETGSHPALLKDAVTTPAGCTVDGILTLEEGGLRVTLIKTIVEATRRSAELLAAAEGK